MILLSTYITKDNKELIDDIVGKPFTLYQAFKMGGIGSKRMSIDKTSENIEHLLNDVSDINYSNIELRPNGIIVMVNRGLDSYHWVIPYRQLVIYKTNKLSIHAQGKFITFKNNKSYKENRKFIDKMIELKSDNQHKYSMPIYG